MSGYGTDDGFNAWLSANGYVLPNDAPAPAVLRERGSAYVDGLYGLRFPGTPTGGIAQERAWPRTGATAYGTAVDPATVPGAIINASYAAAWYEANNPGALSVAVTASAAVKREKVGPLEVEYFGASGDALAGSIPQLSYIEGLLGALFCQPEPAVFVI